MFGILLQVSGTVVQFLEYSVNKSYISNWLCEKKDIPNNGCEGKCHLKKELKKESQREQRNPQQSSKTNVDWQVKESTSVATVLDGVVINSYPEPSGFIFMPGFPESVFHPPGV
jgi:hypothetical protein